MPAGEGGSLFRALTRRSPPISVRGVVNTYLASDEACGLGATALPVRHRRDVETNYSVVYESHFFLCLLCRSYKYVHSCALSGLARARGVWSRRQDRLRVLDICPAVERAAQARELLVVVPPARVIVLRHELPHVMGQLALEPEQSFS